MPVIAFSKADVLRTKTVDTGWYEATITRIDGPKEAKSGGSLNFDVIFTLGEKSPIPGKELNRTFNSKAISMMIPLVAAAKGEAVNENGFQLDTDDLLNKKVDIKVVVDTYEGQLLNKVEEFLPHGAATSKAVAF